MHNDNTSQHPCEAIPASPESMSLAEMILSDCGQSTVISDRLQRRVAGRIQLQMDSVVQQLELERGSLFAESQRKQQLQGQVDALMEAMAKIGRMTMSMYTSAGEAMRDAKRIAHEAIAAAGQAQQAEHIGGVNEMVQQAEPGLYAILYRDNWDGEGYVYHLLAEYKDGKWYADESGKELLQYQGDAILRVWPLTNDKAQPTIQPVGWGMSKKTIAELAAELIRGAECMGDDETELALEIRMPGTVRDDDGNLNAGPVLAISDADYPEEGVYPIDPQNPTAGREPEAQQQAQHHCKNCEGVQPETCGFNVKQQADDADAEWRRLALQFDGHRMQALAHLRGLLENPESHAEAVRAFLAAPPLSGEQVLANRIAEQALKPVSLTRDWPKIEAYVIDAAMRDYVESYEMIGDNNEVCYSPTKAEQELIIDCMRGLLAESDFIDMLTAQPTAQQQIVATQLVCDALVAIVAHSGDPAGTVEALAEWRKKAEAFTRNPAGQPPAVAVPAEWLKNSGWARVPLREQATTVAVPDGYAPMPAEPTPEMVAAGAEGDSQFYDHARFVWRAMFAAAQKDPRQAFADYHLGKPFSIPTTATLRDIAVNSRHGLSVIFCDGDFQVSCTANVWLGDRAVSGWFKELPDAINALWADMEKARQEAAAQKGGAQ